MAMYRLFRLDSAGKFRTFETFDADTDDAARSAARALDREFDCELWLGDRFLGRITKV